MFMAHPKIWSGCLTRAQVLHEFTQSNKQFKDPRLSQSQEHISSGASSIASLLSITSGGRDGGGGGSFFFGNPLEPSLKSGQRVLEAEATRRSSKILLQRGNLWEEDCIDYLGSSDTQFALSYSDESSSDKESDSDSSYHGTNPSTIHGTASEEEEEEATKLLLAASEVHWKNAMESECDSYEVRLSAFEAAAKLGHKEGKKIV
jgi:hypothetical protein